MNRRRIWVLVLAAAAALAGCDTSQRIGTRSPCVTMDQIGGCYFQTIPGQPVRLRNAPQS